MKKIPADISLQILTEKLGLDFSQIKHLYDFRVKIFRSNKKYLKLALALQEKELIKL